MEIYVRRKPRQAISAPHSYTASSRQFLITRGPPKVTFEYLGDRKPVPKLKITQIQTKTQKISHGSTGERWYLPEEYKSLSALSQAALKQEYEDQQKKVKRQYARPVSAQDIIKQGQEKIQASKSLSNKMQTGEQVTQILNKISEYDSTLRTLNQVVQQRQQALQQLLDEQKLQQTLDPLPAQRVIQQAFLQFSPDYKNYRSIQEQRNSNLMRRQKLQTLDDELELKYADIQRVYDAPDSQLEFQPL